MKKTLYQECAADIVLLQSIKNVATHVGHIPEGPRETGQEVPPSLPLETSMQQIEVAVATHLFAVNKII